MEVVANTEVAEVILGHIRNRVVKDRSGIHLSDLCLCIRKAYFRMKKEAPPPTDQQCLLYISGLSFQEYMYPDTDRPIIKDGIVCTPDVAIPGKRGIEIKTGRMNIDKVNLQNSYVHWRRQIMGYCTASDTQEFVLALFSLVGNMRPPFPALKAWTLTFTPEELDANWEEMTAKREVLTNSLRTNTLPEPTCEDWEYKYCECVDLCPDTVCYRKKSLERGGR